MKHYQLRLFPWYSYLAFHAIGSSTQFNSPSENPSMHHLYRNDAIRIHEYYLQSKATTISYKNIAAKPPATAAKLKATVAPAAVDTVATGAEPVAVFPPVVLLPEPVEVPVVFDPGIVAFPGFGMVPL
jgi:hypothetical protein